MKGGERLNFKGKMTPQARAEAQRQDEFSSAADRQTRVGDDKADARHSRAFPAQNCHVGPAPLAHLIMRNADFSSAPRTSWAKHPPTATINDTGATLEHIVNHRAILAARKLPRLPSDKTRYTWQLTPAHASGLSSEERDNASESDSPLAFPTLN